MIFQEGDPKNELYPHMRDYTSFLKKMERPLIGREKEKMMLKAAMLKPEYCNVILLAEAGSGKALDNETEIPVADERCYVKIKDLKVGDKVFDENGNPTTILGVYPQGKKAAYKVTLSDNTSVICNDEHLWTARTRSAHYEDKAYNTFTLREMIDYGIIHECSCGNMKSWYIPAAKPVNRDSRQFAIHPYVMGALIGDGCLSTNRKSALEFSTNDEAVANRIANLIGAKSAVQTNSDNFTWVFERNDAKKSVRNIDIKYIQLSELSELGNFDCVFNTKSIDRSIPREYMNGSIEQRFDLLKGLMDTDGCVVSNDRVNCKFSTNSERLAYDVVELVTSLGMRATVTSEDRDNHVNTEYSVHISCPDAEKHNLFWLERHKEKLNTYIRTDKKFNKIYDDIAISSVEDLQYESEMTCIYVDAPSHLFQCTRNHIVTHNTALVQGTMLDDSERAYLEVDLPKMLSNLKNENEMADKLKRLFKEVEEFRKAENKEIVLFIDEFHQIVQLSPAAVEVLKPLLADSGTRGIRVIAATTYVEYQQYIASNLPLVERLQRINIPEPDRATVVSILRGMAKRYGVEGQFRTDAMFEAIYEYTNRYIPANAQPRKSILMLDTMIGWHRLTKKPIDITLLSDVIFQTEGINVAFRVDATKIKQDLDKKVLAQTFATAAIENRLQICCADLNNKNKPMSSFLFTGSTGVGKTEVSKQLANILFQDERALIRMDMTEYALESSLERFRQELTTNVWTRPYSIVLLDEIEKACAPVTRLLLQVLDDGRLIDRNNREVTFKNAYIIVTTNAGSEIYKTIAQYNVDDTGSGKLMDKYESLIRESIKGTTGGGKFPPELLGRIDCLVPFQPLSEKTMEDICTMKLNQLRDTIRKKHRIETKYDNRLVRYIVHDRMTTDSDAGGARAVVSRIEREITTEISKFINKNPTFRDGKTMYVCVEGELASEHKDQLETKARVVVSHKPIVQPSAQ